MYSVYNNNLIILYLYTHNYVVFRVRDVSERVPNISTTGPLSIKVISMDS